MLFLVRLAQGALALGRVAVTWAPVVFEVYDRIVAAVKKKKPEEKP